MGVSLSSQPLTPKLLDQLHGTAIAPSQGEFIAGAIYFYYMV